MRYFVYPAASTTTKTPAVLSRGVLSLLLITMSALPACAWLQPYKIDIQQGLPITASQVAKLQIGMSQQQVKYLIGSPSIIDPLTPSVWRYSYQFKAGTDAQKVGITSTQDENLRLYFSPAGTLSKIEGASSIPTTYPILPVSKLSLQNQ